MVTEKQRFIAAERQQESTGNYQAQNPVSGALGAYQVLPSNLPGWLAASGQPQMSDNAYLNCNPCQDKLAWVILGGYFDRYGPAGAAAMWYSGQPNPNATYGNPPVYVYVRDVLALMGDPHLPTGPGGPGGTGPGGPPTVNIRPELHAMSEVARLLVWRRMWWVGFYRKHRTSVPGSLSPHARYRP